MERARRYRPGSRSLAARGRSALRKSGETSWSNVAEKVKTRINNAARQATVNIMNDLAERGPRYHGRFINEWYAIPVGRGAVGGSGGYPYTLRSVPRLSTTSKEMDRVVVFEIQNASPYADEAMDLAEGRWIRPDEPPLGGIDYAEKVPGGALYGRRPNRETMRWEVKPNANGINVSTAEKDWYVKYVRGGEMTDQVRRVLRFTVR